MRSPHLLPTSHIHEQPAGRLYKALCAQASTSRGWTRVSVSALTKFGGEFGKPGTYSRGTRRTSIPLGWSSAGLMRKGAGNPPVARPRPFSFAGVGERGQHSKNTD